VPGVLASWRHSDCLHPSVFSHACPSPAEDIIPDPHHLFDIHSHACTTYVRKVHRCQEVCLLESTSHPATRMPLRTCYSHRPASCYMALLKRHAAMHDCHQDPCAPAAAVLANTGHPWRGLAKRVSTTGPGGSSTEATQEPMHVQELSLENGPVRMQPCVLCPDCNSMPARTPKPRPTMQMHAAHTRILCADGVVAKTCTCKKQGKTSGHCRQCNQMQVLKARLLDQSRYKVEVL
jgi:hypothetical protein